MENNDLMVQYLIELKDKIFKILPMKEQNDVTLTSYINGLRVKIMGSIHRFDELKENYKFNSVISIINFMCFNEFDQKLCKKEIFEALELIDDILLCFYPKIGDRIE